MDLMKLTDTSLAGLQQSVTNEARRRSLAATQGRDAASIIRGNEMAKRAASIAAAGQVSILFVGPAICGKTMLRAVCLDLGVDESYEVRPCPCGNHGDCHAICNCTVAQVRRAVAKFPPVDIAVQVIRPSTKDQSYAGQTLADLRQYAAQVAKYTDLSLDEHGGNLLKCSINELGIDTAAVERILRVARTIANLDRTEPIRPIHLCEAINYRSLGNG